jgi:hypothetical protein
MYPPPHFAYFDNYEGVVDPVLFNTNIKFDTIQDAVGPNNTSLRMGKAREIGGYADALKIQCNTCSIENFSSNRLDGLMTIMLQSTGLPQSTSNITLSNVSINYSSSFVNNNYETIQGNVDHFHMLRDACGSLTTCIPMENVTFNYVKVTDVSSTTEVAPMDFSGDNIVFTSINGGKTATSSFNFTKWTGSGSFQGLPRGTTSNSAVEFTTKSPASSVTVYGP